MLRRRAAAAADDIHPQAAHLLGIGRHHLRRAVVVDVAGVVLGHPRVALGHQIDALLPVLGHFGHHRFDLPRPVATVGPNQKDAPTAQHLHRLFGADAHHCVEIRVEGEGDDDRQVRGLLAALDSRLHLPQIAHCFDEDKIGAARGQGRGLLGKNGGGLLQSQFAQGFDQLPGRPHTGGHQSAHRVGHLRGQAHTGFVEFGHPVLQIMQLQPSRCAAEGVGGDDIRAGVQIALIDGLHRFGLLHIPEFGRAAVGQPGLLEHCAHCAVAHQQATRLQPGE